MTNNLYRIDFVGANTGKKLSKTETAIQYLGNLILTRLTQLVIIVFFVASLAVTLKTMYQALFN